MDRFFNAIKGYSGAQAAALGQIRIGTVSSFNPNDNTAKVIIQPEGTLTGWLPVASQWVGNGWGMQSALKGGEQVIVAPQDGDANNGIIIGALFSDQMRPPTASPGEIVFKHSSGAKVSLTQNGGAAIVDAGGAGVTMTNSGTIAMTGVLSVTGSIKVNGVTVNVP